MIAMPFEKPLLHRLDRKFPAYQEMFTLSVVDVFLNDMYAEWIKKTLGIEGASL